MKKQRPRRAPHRKLVKKAKRQALAVTTRADALAVMRAVERHLAPEAVAEYRRLRQASWKVRSPAEFARIDAEIRAMEQGVDFTMDELRQASAEVAREWQQLGRLPEF
jgi:hypothetical protein